MTLNKAYLLVILLFGLSVRADILCREDGSTMEMRAGFMDELKVEGQKLAKALGRAIKSSDWVAKEINQSQDAWVKYRDAHCGAVWHSDNPGSIRLISYPSCLVNLTKQREKNLLQSFTRQTDYVPIKPHIKIKEGLTYSEENKSEEIVKNLNATITNIKLSPDLSLRAVLYESKNTIEEGELQKQVLKIALPGGYLWLRPVDSVNYSKFKFLDNRRLILSRCTLFQCDTIIVDTNEREIVQLGKGSYEVLENDMIKLIGQKYYFPEPIWGAFWVDMIVDNQGNVVRVVPPHSEGLRECVSLNLILDKNTKYPKLKQSMNDCVYVLK